jgi:hypothetical protein
MEFEKYGPLAQSKAGAEAAQTSWVPLVVMLGLGVIAGIAYVQLTQPNMVCGVKRKEQQSS